MVARSLGSKPLADKPPADKLARLERELRALRADMRDPGQAKEQLVASASARLAAAQARARSMKPVGGRIKSTQDQLDGLAAERAAGLAAEQTVALACLERLDTGLLEV